MGYCPYGGCLGRCPQSRIDKGLQRGGDPSYCLICKAAGRTTKFRRALVQPSGSGGKPQAGSDDSKAIKDLVAKNEALEKKVAELASKASSLDHGSATETKAVSTEEQAVQEELQAERRVLKALLDIDQCARGAIGDYDGLVAKARARVAKLDEQRRAFKPVDVQLQQSLHHLKEVRDKHSKNTAAVEATQEAIKELQVKLAEQQAKAAASIAVVHAAEAEVSAKKVAVATHPSTQEPGPDAEQGQASQLTAATVRGFFHALPPSVAGHPHGQEAIKGVMELLEMLDQAAKAANVDQHLPPTAVPTTPSAETAASQSAGSGVGSAAVVETDRQMDLDDETLQQMAEAAVEPATSADVEVVAARTRKVTETQARLSKVRKVVSLKKAGSVL